MTGSRLVLPSQQPIQFNGLPYAGGTLGFYLSGTSTPANTYQDDALVTPNLNPLPLDSAGNCGNVFLDPNIVYKVVLTDSSGNQVWTYDPVYPFPPTTVSSVPSGTIFPFAGVAAPAGFLLCYGQTVPVATYPLLYDAIGTVWGPAVGGTFTLPDFRGRLLAGADNMGGSAANRLTGYGVGTTGGEQTHLLIAAELPVSAYHDTGHTHAITDPTHSHSYTSVGGAATLGSGGTAGLTGALTTGASATGITVNSGTANITNVAGGGSHNNVQPTAGINYIIKF